MKKYTLYDQSIKQTIAVHSPHFVRYYDKYRTIVHRQNKISNCTKYKIIGWQIYCLLVKIVSIQKNSNVLDDHWKIFVEYIRFLR